MRALTVDSLSHQQVDIAHVDIAHVDIAHVAEEIEDLGRRDLREVASLLHSLVEHLIKISCLPASTDLPHWRAEAVDFQMQATDAFSASMRQSLDMPRIWRRGRRLAEVFLVAAGREIFAPVDCPFELHELLADDFAIDVALARLHQD